MNDTRYKCLTRNPFLCCQDLQIVKVFSRNLNVDALFLLNRIVRVASVSSDLGVQIFDRFPFASFNGLQNFFFLFV